MTTTFDSTTLDSGEGIAPSAAPPGEIFDSTGSRNSADFDSPRFVSGLLAAAEAARAAPGGVITAFLGLGRPDVVAHPRGGGGGEGGGGGGGG